MAPVGFGIGIGDPSATSDPASFGFGIGIGGPSATSPPSPFGLGIGIGEPSDHWVEAWPLPIEL